MTKTFDSEPMERRRVRIGLIGVGPGSIAQRVHIPSLRRIPEADIVAVASRSGTGIGQPVQIYRDWAEMYDREPLDLVYVMTPTVAHPPAVMAALERDIHVLCEKPPALTVADARAMVEAAKARGLNLLFCFNRRFAPTYVRLKQLADERGCHTLILEKARGKTEAITPQWMKTANKRWEEQLPAREGLSLSSCLTSSIWRSGSMARSPTIRFRFVGCMGARSISAPWAIWSTKTAHAP